MLDARIHTFLTLYEEMNYSRTAERLNMTQPGVSQHIRKLEEYYGVKLFTYEGRVLERTAEAEILKRHLDSMLVEEKAIFEKFSHGKGLHLRVGATKTIGEFVLVPDVKRFLQDEEHTLEFVIDNTATLLKLLEDGKLDFAVIEGVIDKSRYGWRLYKNESFVGICSKEHRFAGRRVSIEEVFRESLIIRENGSGTRKILERALADRGYSLDDFRRVATLGNFSVIMEMVGQGNSITFAYQPIAEQRENLTTFKVKGMDIEGEFTFVYCNEDIAEEKIGQFFGTF